MICFLSDTVVSEPVSYTHLFGVDYRDRGTITGITKEQGSITGTDKGKYSPVSYTHLNTLVNMTYGTSRVNAYKILEDSLNLKDTRVYAVA